MGFLVSARLTTAPWNEHCYYPGWAIEIRSQKGPVLPSALLAAEAGLEPRAHRPG